MVLWTGRFKFWHNGAKKIWQKAKIFHTMSQTYIKKMFPKISFFSKKRSSGHIECSFGNPVDFFEETPKFSVGDKTERSRNDFLEKKWFSTRCFRSRRLQFWLTKTKVFNKKVICSRSMSENKKCWKRKNNFFRRTFFHQKLPMGKERAVLSIPQEIFVKRPKKYGSIFDTDRKAQKLLTFSTKSSCGHVKMKVWLPRPNFHDERLKFLCQVSANHKKNNRFSKKNFK